MNQRSNCQHSLDHRKSRRFLEKHLLCFIDHAKVFDCVDHNKLWKTQQWPQDRKGRFPCNRPKGWFQRMFNYHTVTLISNATKVISPSKSSMIHELWNIICSSWIWKRQRNQRSNCQHSLDDRKSKSILEKHLLLLYWPCKSLRLCRLQQTVENLQRLE